jgi:hypothetical protein
MMICGTLGMYKNWLETASAERIEWANHIYTECTKHYDAGGDWVVESFTPDELDDEFDSLVDVVEYCGLKVNQELNCRWGNDDDPELARYDRWKTWLNKVTEQGALKHE